MCAHGSWPTSKDTSSVRNKPRHVRAWRVSGRVVDGARVRARVCVHRPGQVRRVESR